MVVVPLDEFDIDEISKVLQALEETKNIKEGKLQIDVKNIGSMVLCFVSPKSSVIILISESIKSL